MSVIYACDGCGAPVESPIKIGHALRRDYCAACEPRAKAYVAAEEDLRKRLTEQFATDRALLVAKASDGGFKLPDVPDAA